MSSNYACCLILAVIGLPIRRRVTSGVNNEVYLFMIVADADAIVGFKKVFSAIEYDILIRDANLILDSDAVCWFLA